MKFTDKARIYKKIGRVSLTVCGSAWLFECFGLKLGGIGNKWGFEGLMRREIGKRSV